MRGPSSKKGNIFDIDFLKASKNMKKKKKRPKNDTSPNIKQVHPIEEES